VIQEGENVSVTQSGNTLTISATGAELADNAVSTAKLQDGAITTAKLENDAVSETKIQDSAISNNKLQDSAITSGKIAGSQVVRSINDLQDDVSLTAGSNITITSNGNTLTIASTIADNDVNTAKLQDGAVTSAKLQDGSVTNAKISSGQVVKTINNLKDDVTLAAGNNVTITPSGNTLTFAATSESGMPPGVIMAFAGTSEPSGWLICDGRGVSRSTYADLFNVIGTTYGTGDGSTTFNLPNLAGRVPLGRDSGDSDFDSMGETGGEKKHTLTTDEMPSHNHVVDVRFGGDETGSGTLQGAATTTSSLTTKNTGGGNPHNSLQPYIVLNFIIKN